MSTNTADGIYMPHPYLTRTTYGPSMIETSHSPTNSMSSISEISENWTPFTESTNKTAVSHSRASLSSESEHSMYGGSRSRREQKREVTGSAKASPEKRRGPGRPRKPDNELRRPRRERGDGRGGRKSGEGVGGERKVVGRVMKSLSRKEVVKTRTREEDQVIIATQQHQIETMQQKLIFYETRLKSLESARNNSGSTPPTPAMSINRSSSYTIPTTNPSISTINSSEDTQTEREREDSPLSVYSDLNLDDLVDQGNDRMDIQRSWCYSRPEVRDMDSFVVILKANPVAGADIGRSEEERRGLVKRSVVWSELVSRWTS